MRHLQVGRKLGVDSSHRIALLRSLSLALIEKDLIKTTTARAKELRWYADRIVTLAKRGDLHSRRQIVRLLGSTETGTPGQNRVRLALEKVYGELVPRFKTRPGGYTQILHLAMRRNGDNAEMCVMRYLPSADEAKGKKPAPKDAKSSKKAESKVEASAADKAPKAKKAAPQEKPAKATKKDK